MLISQIVCHTHIGCDSQRKDWIVLCRLLALSGHELVHRI
jgi:hypothetical protein